MEADNDEVVRVPLDFHIPEEMPLSYATTVVAQHTQDEFVLSFFAVTPPLILGDSASVRQQQAEITSLPAQCVARVVLTPSRMAQLLAVVKENLSKYEERFGAISQDEAIQK